MNGGENESSKRKKKEVTLDWFVNVQKKTKTHDDSSSSQQNISHDNTKFPSRERENQFDATTLPHDPGMRKGILDYHPNDQDMARREYMQRGPCQPRDHCFPQSEFGNNMRRVNPMWFNRYSWLEYSVQKDAAFCFLCYLFKVKDEFSGKGGDAFVNNGFRSWNMPNRFDKHVGSVNSIHNRAREKFEMLMKPEKSIQSTFDHQSTKDKKNYRTRLLASLHCLRYLLHQGLATRGHDESEESSNKGNFLELLEWLAKHNEDIDKVVLKNAPKNLQVTAHSIQKELINSCAKETTKAIIRELGEDYFVILVDESSDITHKEQMSLCLRYVDKKGDVVERFLGVTHVTDTTSLSLKNAIHSLLAEYSLSPSKIRGQGYDGASNMKGEINGLKTLMLKETPSAFYVHCFAHQLQLTLVAVSKKSIDCGWLFEILTNLLNVIGVSCKRKEMLREAQAQKVAHAFDDGELKSGKGLNQELSLGRPGDTRWGSHYKLIVNVISLYPMIRDVLHKIGDVSSSSDDRLKADVVSYALESFDFIFMIHLMKTIFGVANDLNNALQRKDQDIVNAMLLVTLTKQRLQQIRDDGWETLLSSVISFCEKSSIEAPNMEDVYVPRGRKKRGKLHTTNLHHFRVEDFIAIIDLQLQELENRFDEVSMNLLVYMASLSPVDEFSAFDKEKLISLAKMYPNEFPSALELARLDDQLDNYIFYMKKENAFKGLKDIKELSNEMVRLDKHKVFDRVYLLIKLVLILPVATASVERAFSAMNFVKNKLRNSMGDQFLNDCLVTYIEKDVFSRISDDDIINPYQNMKTRRERL